MAKSVVIRPGIDAGRRLRDHRADDGDSGFQSAQLFQAFQAFQAAGRQASVAQQDLRAIGVQAKVAMAIGSWATGISIPRQRRAAEGQGPIVRSQQHLHGRWIQLFRGTDRGGQGGDTSIRMLAQHVYHQTDMLRVQFRLIALDIDQDLGLESGSDFGDPIGPALMKRVGQTSLITAALGDSDQFSIVGTHPDTRGTEGLRRLPAGVQQQRLTGFRQQEFVRKTSAGAPGWDQNGYLVPHRRPPRQAGENRLRGPESMQLASGTRLSRIPFMAQRAFTKPLGVCLVNRLIQNAFDDIGTLEVTGELSDLRVVRSGHCYLTLKEADEVLQGVIWRSALARLGQLPAMGERVLARGKLSLYGPRGSFQLVITRISSLGAGDLAARFEQLKQLLREQGLFDESRKRPLPWLPRAVGLATAGGSAALADLRQGLDQRFPDMPVIHAPCQVQGTEAAASICRALVALDRHPEVDVIICGRGGGSLEDLWAFNEETVVRALAACQTPLISAVGHETDTSLADLVADARAKTPSTAAEMAVPLQADLQAYLADTRTRLDRLLATQLQQNHDRLAALAAHRALLRPEHQILLRQQRCDELADRLDHLLAARLRQEDRQLGQQAAQLDALSPLKVIARGYSVLADDSGRIIRRCEEAPVGSQLQARVSDGHLLLTVADKETSQSS
jgi:exodeoxyribonuclease VII large subunit